MGGLILVLKWIDYRFFLRAISVEVYVGIIALICTGIGLWMGLQLTRTRKQQALVPATTVPTFAPNPEKLSETGLSSREYEVLELMAQGLSNQEIAAQLFISLNTVKTHSSNLYVKLNAKRRTQAVQVAKELGILP